MKVVLCFLTRNEESSISNLKYTFGSNNCVVLKTFKPKRELNTMVHFGITLEGDLSREEIKARAEQSLGKDVFGVDVILEDDPTWNSRWSMLL